MIVPENRVIIGILISMLIGIFTIAFIVSVTTLARPKLTRLHVLMFIACGLMVVTFVGLAFAIMQVLR